MRVNPWWLLAAVLALTITGCSDDGGAAAAGPPSAPPSGGDVAAVRAPGFPPVSVDRDRTPKHYAVAPGGSVVLRLSLEQDLSPPVPLSRVAALVLPAGRLTDSTTNRAGSDVPLRSFEERDVPARQRELRWTFDGNDSAGQQLPAGTYNLAFVIESVDQQGELRGTAQSSGVVADISVE
jgi:hypothetical protein